jgi:hypothetical protein
VIANAIFVFACGTRGLVTCGSKRREDRENDISNCSTERNESGHDTTNPFWFQKLSRNRQTVVKRTPRFFSVNRGTTLQTEVRGRKQGGQQRMAVA